MGTASQFKYSLSDVQSTASWNNNTEIVLKIKNEWSSVVILLTKHSRFYGQSNPLVLRGVVTMCCRRHWEAFKGKFNNGPSRQCSLLLLLTSTHTCITLLAVDLDCGVDVDDVAG